MLGSEILAEGNFEIFAVDVLAEIEEMDLDDALSTGALDGRADAYPYQLSGGMKKRVGLARAICYDPQVIVYDEPTTGLDPINSDVINDLIISMQEKLKVTSVVVTHDMTSAYKVADRIAMLYRGEIIGVGTPEDIQNTKNPVIRQFVTGSAHGPITDGSSKLK